jgi:LDH2 family malate/lactate/ureidoglycolate dehydrogenase
MVEVFSGLLTGLGYGIDPEGRHNDGVFIAAFNLAHFRDVDEFKKDMDGFVEYIKDSPPAAGFDEVLYPGEIEWNREQARRKDGIFVEDETWSQLTDLMKSLNVEGEVGQP